MTLRSYTPAHTDSHPTSTPPQRFERMLLAAVEQHNIVKADCVPACDVVAIALLQLCIVECLGVSEDNARAATLAERQLRKGSGQRLAIEQHLCGCAWWNGERAFRKSRSCRIRQSRPDNGSGTLLVVGHLWQRVRHQPPR